MGQSSTLAVVLGLLLMSLAPAANAGLAGGIAIDISSVVIEGDSGIGVGSVWINLSLEEIDGKAANASLSATITTSEGVVMASASEAVQLTASSNQAISLELTGIQPGQHQINLSLSGDLSLSLPVGYANSWNASSNRLRPLDVGLASLAQWLAEPVNDSQVDTGNSSIRDGDWVRLTIPIVNAGDIDWNGSIRVISSQQNVILDINQSINMSADSTFEVIIQLPQVSEGSLVVQASLSNLSDEDSSDDSNNLSYSILAPPLAELKLSLTALGEGFELGETSHFKLLLENQGEADWSGNISCIAADEETVLLFVSTSIAIATNQSWNLSTEARPGKIVCAIEEGVRVSTSSNLNANHSFAMTAGNLILTGGQGISLSGGPWHVGDKLLASVLIHNNGDADSTASLWLREDGEWSKGEVVSIPLGSSLELTSSHLIQTNGSHNISWKVSSSDSLVSSELLGMENIDSETEQSLDVEIESITWDAVEGIEITWSIEMDDGPSRLLDISIGLLVQGQRDERLVMQLELQAGRRNLQSDLGLFDGSALVYIDVDRIDWGLEGSQVITLALPSQRPELELTINPISTPKRPESGKEASIFCTISNAGVQSKEGTMLLIGSDGTVFDEKDVGRIGDSKVVEFTIESWPAGDDVPLICRWNDGIILTSSNTFLSDMDAVSSQQSSTELIPFMAIGTGLAIALGAALVIRLGRSWYGDSEQRAERKIKRENERQEKSAEREKSTASASDEKREISCTSCHQGLKVPSSYSGTVSCPSCKHQFKVEGSTLPAPVLAEKELEELDLEDELDSFDDGLDDELIEEVEEELSSSSSGDILGCPTCSAKLRVPLDQRPATARCPACKTEFRALIS
ncbi:MAG: hypothetical protein ACKVHH_03645 [Candidatus Poseidoniales archaeon]